MVCLVMLPGNAIKTQFALQLQLQQLQLLSLIYAAIVASHSEVLLPSIIEPTYIYTHTHIHNHTHLAAVCRRLLIFSFLPVIYHAVAVVFVVVGNIATTEISLINAPAVCGQRQVASSEANSPTTIIAKYAACNYIHTYIYIHTPSVDDKSERHAQQRAVQFIKSNLRFVVFTRLLRNMTYIIDTHTHACVQHKLKMLQH